MATSSLKPPACLFRAAGVALLESKHASGLPSPGLCVPTCCPGPHPQHAWLLPRKEGKQAAIDSRHGWENAPLLSSTPLPSSVRAHRTGVQVNSSQAVAFPRYPRGRQRTRMSHPQERHLCPPVLSSLLPAISQTWHPSVPARRQCSPKLSSIKTLPTSAKLYQDRSSRGGESLLYSCLQPCAQPGARFRETGQSQRTNQVPRRS